LARADLLHGTGFEVVHRHSRLRTVRLRDGPSPLDPNGQRVNVVTDASPAQDDGAERLKALPRVPRRLAAGLDVRHADGRDAELRTFRLEPLAVGNQLEARGSLDARIIVTADAKSGLVVVGQEQGPARCLSVDLIGEGDLQGFRSP